MKSKVPKAALAAVATAAAAATAYSLRYRDRCLTWGTRTDEATRAMPGDDLLPDAPLVTTRAVTVEAPPAAVWPWLVQMGPGRGGAYTYDWIENLFGLGMHSADTVLPQFQDLKPGDCMRLGAKGPLMRVELLDPEHALAFQSDDGVWVWAFELQPDGERTRLVSRNRIDDPRRGLPARAVMRYIMEPGSLVMERKMLLGIKARAERLAQARDEGTAVLEGGPAELAGRVVPVGAAGADAKIEFGNGYEHFRATVRRAHTPEGWLPVYEWWERTEMPG